MGTIALSGSLSGCIVNVPSFFADEATVPQIRYFLASYRRHSVSPAIAPSFLTRSKRSLFRNLQSALPIQPAYVMSVQSGDDRYFLRYVFTTTPISNSYVPCIGRHKQSAMRRAFPSCRPDRPAGQCTMKRKPPQVDSTARFSLHPTIC